MNAIERLLFEVEEFGAVTTDGVFITLPEGTPAELVARVRERKAALIALLRYLDEVRKLDVLAEKANLGDTEALQDFEQGLSSVEATEAALRAYGVTSVDLLRILEGRTA